MKNKSVSIPIGMLTKKFYCHKCGGRLIKHSKTKLLSRGDPEYRKHSTFNHGTHMIGDVEVTEYDFKCPDCGNIIEYDEQCVVSKIQKLLGRSTLSEKAILDNKDSIKGKIKRKNKVFKVIISTVTVAIVALILYYKIKSGDFSFEFNF